MATNDKKKQNDKQEDTEATTTTRRQEDQGQDNVPGQPVKEPVKEPTAAGEKITNPKVRAQVGLPVEDTRARDAAAQPETSDIGPAVHTNQSNPKPDRTV